MPCRNAMNLRSRVAIFCVLVMVAIVGCVPQSFADGFERPLFKWSYDPQICVLEPSDPRFPGLGQKMFVQTQNAVLDWQTKLNGGNAYGAWKLALVDIPASKAGLYDQTNCDITVHFKPSPDDPSEKFNEAGVTEYKSFPKVSVTVYYLGVNLREQYKTFWQNGTYYYTYLPIPYFTGYLASDPQLAMTIRHEIGHSLGLGHYIVPEGELTRIVEGSEDMPSIMVTTVFTYGVTHFDVTQLDIKEIESIYGTGGIPAKPHALNVPTSTEIAGSASGAPTGTNSSQDQFNGTMTKLPLWIKHIAKWWSQGKVSDKEFTDSMEYLVQHGILNLPKTHVAGASNSIPMWIQKNAGYWSEGKITDYEFIRGIQYLVSIGAIKVS